MRIGGRVTGKTQEMINAAISAAAAGKTVSWIVLTDTAKADAEALLDKQCKSPIRERITVTKQVNVEQRRDTELQALRDCGVFVDDLNRWPVTVQGEFVADKPRAKR